MAAGIKPEDQNEAGWHSYRNHLPPPPRLSNGFEHGLPQSHLSSPYNGAHRSSYPPPPDNGMHRGWRMPEESDHRLSHPTPLLSSPNSYSSLKRSYQDASGNSFIEAPQDMREGGPDMDGVGKPSIHQDHRLLSFARMQDRHTITDQHGRIQMLDLSAQIHGMFFLSEISTTSGDSTIISPELTCYRRNLFQISGSVTIPRGPLFVVTERGEKVQIVDNEVSVLAVESVDGNNVRLIVIPWKTPPPNSPEIETGEEKEPLPISLPFVEDPNNPNSEATLYPIAWKRLQFRIATANNGRRKELQQHFVLRLNITATLANGTKTSICEVSTAPIVVRGRSPRNFQTRKEIPLLGSSSASRGSAMQSLQSPTALSIPPPGPGGSVIHSDGRPKQGSVDLARSPPRGYDSSSPVSLRHGSFSAWNPTQQPGNQTPTTASYSTAMTYPSAQPTLPSFSSPSSTSSADVPNPSSLSMLPIPSSSEGVIRPQYAYAPVPHMSPAPLRYMDSNPRPSKSPRHTGPPPAHLPPMPSSDYHSYDEQNHNYVPSFSSAEPTSREYFSPPTTMALSGWSNNVHAEHHPHMEGNGQAPQSPIGYAYSQEGYARMEPQPVHHAWSSAA